MTELQMRKQLSVNLVKMSVVASAKESMVSLIAKVLTIPQGVIKGDINGGFAQWPRYLGDTSYAPSNDTILAYLLDYFGQAAVNISSDLVSILVRVHHYYQEDFRPKYNKDIPGSYVFRAVIDKTQLPAGVTCNSGFEPELTFVVGKA